MCALCSIYLDSRGEEEEVDEEENMCGAYTWTHVVRRRKGTCVQHTWTRVVRRRWMRRGTCELCTQCEAYLDSRGEEEVEEEGNMCAAYTWTRVVRRR